MQVLYVWKISISISIKGMVLLFCGVLGFPQNLQKAPQFFGVVESYVPQTSPNKHPLLGEVVFFASRNPMHCGAKSASKPSRHWDVNLLGFRHFLISLAFGLLFFKASRVEASFPFQSAPQKAVCWTSVHQTHQASSPTPLAGRGPRALLASLGR